MKELSEEIRKYIANGLTKALKDMKDPNYRMESERTILESILSMGPQGDLCYLGQIYSI